MTSERIEKNPYLHTTEDRLATEKDLKILSLQLDSKILALGADLESKMSAMGADLESKMSAMGADLERKISSITIKLSGVIVGVSSLLFVALTYFHK